MRKLLASTLFLAITVAFPQTYPTLPDPVKIAATKAIIPHTLSVCNYTVTNAAEFSSSLIDVVAPLASSNQTICMRSVTLSNGDPGTASYIGNFEITPAAGSNFLTIRTTRASELPASGNRIRLSDAPKLAKIVSPNPRPGLFVRPGANSGRVRLIGLEFTTTSSASGELLKIGTNNTNPSAGPIQDTVAKIPNKVAVDRCVVHGLPLPNKAGIGIWADGNYVAVVNSYIYDIHDGTGDDQAILAMNGEGPFYFENNFLEAAGENVMFGGGDPGIRLVPSDIVIRGNYFWKNPAYFPGHAVYKVKNLFELKTGRRLLLEGNVFENFWSGVQSQYFAIVWKSANQGAVCKVDNGYYGQTAHITFRYNKLINIPQAFVIGRAAACNKIEEGTSHVYVHDNVIEGLGYGHTGDGAPKLVLWSYPLAEPGGEVVYPRHVTIAHNTVGTISGKPSGGSPNGGAVWGMDQIRYQHLETQGNYVHNFYFDSNIFPGRWFVTGTYNSEATILGRFKTPLQTKNNVYASPSSPAFASNPNFQAPNLSALFVNSGAGDFRLTPANAAKYPGHDGRPAGADINIVDACAEGATSNWTGNCPGSVTPPSNCPTQSVILSRTSIKTGSNSVATAPAGWFGGTMTSSDTSKVTLHLLPTSIGYMATGVITGSSNITGSNWTAANGATGCALSASPLAVTAPGTEILVFDWNRGIPNPSGRNVEGLTSFQPNNQPVRYNVDWTAAPNFANGTYYGRIFQGCQAVNEEWTWQINHWKGDPIGSTGELYSDLASTDLHFVWSGTPILRAFVLPIADLISHPDRPAWTWTTPRVIMGFMPNQGSGVPPNRQLDNAVYPMDLRFMLVNVAPGGTFSGWPAWTTNGLGERNYDCSFPTPVQITTPLNGETVSGSATIAANALDNVGITKVDFSIDNVIVASDNLAPYSLTWDTSTYSTGAHTIVARAYDLAGNTNSHSISVTVQTGGTLSVVLSANNSTVPITVTPAAAVVLGWVPQGATACSAFASSPYGLSIWSGSKNPIGGTQTINPTQSATYSISCTGGGGAESSQTASVTVNVSQACADPPL